jgi:hypothetical protein
MVIILLKTKRKLSKKNKPMGHKIKIQRVERGATKSFYVNFPAALAEAALIEKGEEMEWLVEDRNTFVLRRIKPKKPVVKRKTPLT